MAFLFYRGYQEYVWLKSQPAIMSVSLANTIFKRKAPITRGFFDFAQFDFL